MFSFRFAPLALSTIVVVAVSGCVSTNLRSDKDFLVRSAIEDQPVMEPVRSVSGFGDGLACMDQMLRDRQVGTTLITGKDIADPTGQVAVGTEQMVITALSQMSRTSNAFRYVDFEVSYSNQDTVQVLTQMLLASGQMNIEPPTVYVSGSVSFMDKNILTAKRDAGIDHPDGGLGLSKDAIASQVGLEMHLGDFFSRSLLPGIEASNQIALANKGAGTDLGARIGKAGVDFSIFNDLSQGIGPAMRALVDLSMIELVGKWARVPYWQCVSLDQAHPEFQRELYQWYSDMGTQERVRFMQTGLRTLGYFSGAPDGLYSEALKQALARFQMENDAVPTGNINFETYERIAKRYVRKDGTGRFISVGWDSGGDNRWAKGLSKETPADVPQWGEIPPPPQVDMTLGRASPVFELGESLRIGMTVSRSAHLYCYYRDAAGAITQIYPNPMQADQPVLSTQALSVPGANAGFSIDLVKPGQESALCIAAGSSLDSLWPESMRGEALSPLAGVSSLEQIAAMAEEKLPGKVSARTIQWQVK